MNSVCEAIFNVVVEVKHLLFGREEFSSVCAVHEGMWEMSLILWKKNSIGEFFGLSRIHFGLFSEI